MASNLLNQVHYATALDWFIICSFLYCMASILEFAGVHYFTKVALTTTTKDTSLVLDRKWGTLWKRQLGAERGGRCGEGGGGRRRRRRWRLGGRGRVAAKWRK